MEAVSTQLLLLALLASDVEVPAHCRDALFELARQWEVLEDDDRHVETYTALRRRFGELLSAPPTSDVVRFPPREVLDGLLAGLNAQRSEVAAGWVSWQSADRRELAVALGIEVEILGAIRDAGLDTVFSAPHRRRRLARARELMGWRDYYMGRIVPGGR